ncbi:ubiquitin-ribosomal protein eL40 fusion protein-like [Brevipalpus obovatus]|uniref:ubiquitin-ribosomal protein eL40 fusion protein-like n=1 Tax=Brevipalpus obovatus TaxID=246614 RepID=UPI003D9DE9D7
MGFVCLRNLRDESLLFEIDLDSDIAKLKEAIQERESIPTGKQLLYFAGQPLEDGHSLSYYGVSAGSTLNLNLPVRGGVIEPSLLQLAKKYNIEKKVCRKCYARLHAKATNCRKRKCGHSSNLRPKKKPKT